MAALFEIAEGWTEPLDVQLLLSGAAFDATGMTVTATVRDRNGAVVNVACAWVMQTSAIARLSPVSTDFVAANGPYTVRFKVVDGSGKVTFFPPTTASSVNVYPV
jgi:hypothetical protein